jgi:organic radical activating enzyme
MEYVVGDLSKQTLSDVWNSKPMRDLRLNMLNGKKSESCKRCYAFEDAGQQSMRNTLNERYAHHFLEVENTTEEGAYNKLNLVYWDFRFSNICNFKCRMCGPQLSSGWYEDTKKIYGTLPSDIPNDSDPDKLWQQIIPLFDTVEEIYFAGGEPLIMEEHYRILNKLVEMQKFDVHIRYNSNCSQFRYKSMNVLDIWPKFEKVDMFASLDGSWKRGELIRKGQSWQKFLDNRQQMKIKSPNVKFTINYTLTVLNSFHSMDFHKEVYEQGIINDIDDFRLNFAVNPDHLCVHILPLEIKEKLKESINEYVERYLIPNGSRAVADHFRSYIKFIDTVQTQHLIPKMIDHMDKIDSIRSESWRTVFPELYGILL